jgi:hypothetical protein
MIDSAATVVGAPPVSTVTQSHPLMPNGTRVPVV